MTAIAIHCHRALSKFCPPSHAWKKSPLFVLLFSLCIATAPLFAAEPPPTELKVGAVVYDEVIGSTGTQERWGQQAPWAKLVPEGAKGSSCLRIDVPEGVATAADGSVQKDVNGVPIKLKAGRFEVTRELDLRKMRGWRIKLIALVRAANVPAPEVPWEGIRLGIGVKTPITEYGFNAGGLKIQGDWAEVELKNVRIPDDATNATLFLGLISHAGTLWVQKVQIVLVEPPFAELAKKQTLPPAKTVWRGAGLGGGAAPGVKTMATKWHGNVGKWWIRLPSPDISDENATALLDAQLTELDDGLAAATAVGAKIIVQLCPGRGIWCVEKLGGTHRCFLEKKAADRVLSSWKMIATRYKGNPAIRGYDLLNEPVLRVPPGPGCDDWEGLAQKTAQLINQIDPAVTIYMQPEEWWGVNAFQKLRPIQAKNVVYSVHMYAPFEVTHQGIKERKSLGKSYPGTIGNVVWNKETLRTALRPAREFQKAYGVPMQVGEFGCIRWAPDDSQSHWLNDVTELFEEYGWDWTYHAFSDWDGWDAELESDPANTQIRNEASLSAKVLRNLMNKNVLTVKKD